MNDNDVSARLAAAAQQAQQPPSASLLGDILDSDQAVASAAQNAQQEAAERAQLVGRSVAAKALHVLKWRSPQLWPLVAAELSKVQHEFGLADLEDALSFTTLVQTGMSIATTVVQREQYMVQARMGGLTIALLKHLHAAREKNRSQWADARVWASEPAQRENLEGVGAPAATGPRATNEELQALLASLTDQGLIRRKDAPHEYDVMATSRGIKLLQQAEQHMREAAAANEELANATCDEPDCDGDIAVIVTSEDGEQRRLCAAHAPTEDSNTDTDADTDTDGDTQGGDITGETAEEPDNVSRLPQSGTEAQQAETTGESPTASTAADTDTDA